MQAARLTLLAALGLFALHADAGEVRVAVAANFTAPMKQIAALFQADTGHTVQASYGSTGKFYAQIKNGAPYDVFLAADAATPTRLGREGLADPASQFTYARGKLALWSKQPGYVDGKGEILKGPFGKLAIANPALAPYGRAAQETLQKLGLWDVVQGRLVMGENISQTLQFADSGAVDLAFVAMSQTVKDGKPVGGSVWAVPQSLYAPIRQDAVVLAQPQDKAAALAFMNYLRSAKAVTVIKRFGYDLP
ncbi:MAG: molybdate ABC transporter substrate-binding protein [Hyphomicrobiaceae bacterium]